jgi:hypothetical protein
MKQSLQFGSAKQFVNSVQQLTPRQSAQALFVAPPPRAKPLSQIALCSMPPLLELATVLAIVLEAMVLEATVLETVLEATVAPVPPVPASPSSSVLVVFTEQAAAMEPIASSAVI